MTAEELDVELRSIAHMDLGLRYDVDRMRAEVAKITQYEPYKSAYGSVEQRRKYAQYWSGRTLRSWSADSFSGMQEHSPDGSKILVDTDLASQCPYLMGIVHGLRGYVRPARVMRVSARGRLAWHSHVENQRQKTTSVVVHIPILMPEEFIYCVTPKDNLLNGEPLDPVRVYAAKYTPGKAIYFNSFHYHNVFNDSGEDRVSLMVYLDLRDPVTRTLVEDVVSRYTGPRII